MGITTRDDAAAYRLNDGKIILQTVDFFTPVVDDPFTYGQIAAANALSDIYAMGGRPLTALNIVAFPCQMGDIFVEVLRGGIAKVEEAGALVVGGHSIEDKEPKYGLSVTGLVEGGQLKLNSQAKAGDLLVLTKPIGFGILATALKRGIISEANMSEAIDGAVTLNKNASAAMVSADADAATDISGFGLIGHLFEMMKASKTAALLNATKIPIWKRSLKLANEGCVPGGTVRNRSFFGNSVELTTPAAEALDDILFDPQTSGGLLIAISPEKIDVLLSLLNQAGVERYAVIGEVVSEETVRIEVK